MRRKVLVGTLLLLTGVLLVTSGLGAARSAAAAAAASEQAALSQRVIRLHVVANSDSDADQDLKRTVRDAILDEITPLFTDMTTPAQAREAVQAAIPRIEAVAAATVAAHGYSYPVKAELGLSEFPGKAYGDTYLPAGEYTALKVMIGEAAGANWWCVLFPPLCFEDWATGVVREPKNYGATTVTVPRRQPAPALVDEERTRPVPVKARVAAWEWAKSRFHKGQAAQ